MWDELGWNGMGWDELSGGANNAEEITHITMYTKENEENRLSRYLKYFIVNECMNKRLMEWIWANEWEELINAPLSSFHFYIMIKFISFFIYSKSQ